MLKSVPNYHILLFMDVFMLYILFIYYWQSNLVTEDFKSKSVGDWYWTPSEQYCSYIMARREKFTLSCTFDDDDDDVVLD